MGLKLKIVRGHTPNERMKSVDGLLHAHDKRLQARAPDEKLKAEIASLKQTVDMLLDHLGLAVEPSPKKVIKRVRIADETDTINPV